MGQSKFYYFYKNVFILQKSERVILHEDGRFHHFGSFFNVVSFEEEKPVQYRFGPSELVVVPKSDDPDVDLVPRQRLKDGGRLEPAKVEAQEVNATMAGRGKQNGVERKACYVFCYPLVNRNVNWNLILAFD
jgi:hypothetical protein